MISPQQLALHQRALSAANKYRSSHAELLEVVVEVERSRLYEAFQLTSSYEYCRSQLSLSEGVAYSFCQVARRSLEVPALKAAVDEGLDFTKAKQVARVLTPENQEELLAKAKESSSRELQKAIVKIHPEEAVIEQVKPVAEDRNKLQLGISDELFRKLRRVQDLVCNKSKKSASFEDALVAMVDLYLEREDPLLKAERARPAGPASANSEHIPAASVHAVNQRDRGACQHPGCGGTRWVEIHHRRARSEGGGQEPENLITLCGYHHRQLHREERKAWHGFNPARDRVGEDHFVRANR